MADDNFIDADKTRTASLQRVAFWVTVAAVVLCIGAATGLSPIPKGAPGWAWIFHPMLLLFGAVCGDLTILRSREIDTARWQVVSGADLTSGERSLAHSEAEAGKRSAARSFLLAGVAVGAWLAYQVGVLDMITAADLLVATPVLGFGLGLWLGTKRYAKVEPRL